MRTVWKVVCDCLRPPDVWDWLALLGLAFFLRGMWLIFPPLAHIGAGLTLMILSAWGAFSWKKREKKSSKF